MNFINDGYRLSAQEEELLSQAIKSHFMNSKEHILPPYLSVSDERYARYALKYYHHAMHILSRINGELYADERSPWSNEFSRKKTYEQIQELFKEIDKDYQEAKL